MALQVRRNPSVKVRMVTTLMMVFALVAQPLYGFVSAQIASAAPLTAYSNAGFSSFTWVTDRLTPSGGYNVVGDSLTMRVDNTLASSTPGFYRTEGIKTTLPAGTNSIKAELFVDAAWASKPIRAGIWGDGAGYPIIEYTNGIVNTETGLAGHTGWRVYDTNTGVWHNIATPVALEQWYSLEVAINPTTNTYDFYVNNVKVGPSFSSSYTSLGGMIFNNFNSATGNTTDNYSVQWRNLSAGKVVTLAQRIAAANAGDIIDITENETVTGQIAVNKPLTITSSNDSVITTSGTGNLFRTSAPGVTFSNLTFNKTDKTSQHIVSIGADDTIIRKNVFNGQYVLGDGETARALEVSTVSGLVIDGNTFNAFRQPAYINGGVSGSISNNSVNGTRGWVAHANTDLQFNGNTFSGNALDIALLAPTPLTSANNYGCSKIYAIKSANNNASIQNQTPGFSCAPTVSSNGSPHNSYERSNDFYFTWNASIDDSSAVTYEFQSATSNSVDSDGSLVGSWNSKRDGNGEQKNLTNPTIHSTGAPDGKYYWQVRAMDASGNASAWSPVWNMTIDSKAPLAPNNLGLKVTATSAAISANGFTNKNGVTAIWASNNTDQVTYVYKYWNDVASSAYKQNTPWSNPLTGVSYQGVVNEGEGKHFFCVAAKDQAGNESACSATYGFTYDATAPDAAINGVSGGQNVTGDVSLQGIVTDKNLMNSYFVITGPNNYSQSSFYGDGRGLHEYLWKTGSLVNGTYKVQFEARDKADNKGAGSVTSLSVVVNNPQPAVAGENFSTHSSTDYKGVNVGFNIANFKTVTGVSVALYDADDNLLATNTHNQKLLDLIEGGVAQLSTPFIGTAGTYVEEFWNLGIPSWTSNSKPSKAVVTVSGTNSANVATSIPVTLAQLSEANGVAFEDTLPLMTVVPVSPPVEEEIEDEEAADNGQLPLIINQLATATPLPGSNGIIFGTSLANGFTSSDTEQATSDETAAVLGTQTSNEKGDVSDIAKNVAAIEPSAEGWKFFGFAWYWLALLIAAIAAIWYVVARRRNQGA